MNTTIDVGGRIVVPKTIRELAGLVPGMALEIRFRDGRVEIEPAPASLVLDRSGGVLVGRPEGAVPPMPSAVVDATLDVQRRERG